MAFGFGFLSAVFYSFDTHYCFEALLIQGMLLNLGLVLVDAYLMTVLF